LRLAGTGRADHAQPERREFEPPRPGCEAARQPCDERAGLADERARVGREREFIGEKVVDFRRARQARLVGRQRFANHGGQPVAPGRVDNARGVHPGNRGVFHDVVGAVQKFFDEIRARAERRGKAPMQPFDGVRKRDRHVAFGLQIDLD